MNWASRRKMMYVSIIMGVIALSLVYPIYSFFDTEPTCFDGKQNQNEQGVDCGGICQLLCAHQVSPMQILWARSFKVRDGVYNALAFVENPNFNAAVEAIEYTFLMYDQNNLLVQERYGVTHIATDGITPIFESGIETGNRDIWRTTFEFRSAPWWKRIPEQPDVVVENVVVESNFDEPRIEAVIHNKEVFDVRDVEVVVAVFDEEGNAMAGSKTHVSYLQGGTDRPIFFTWPNPFPRNVGRIDIVPRIRP